MPITGHRPTQANDHNQLDAAILIMSMGCTANASTALRLLCMCMLPTGTRADVTSAKVTGRLLPLSNPTGYAGTAHRRSG